MTQEQKDYYMEHGGELCPVCHKDHLITIGPPDNKDDGIVAQQVGCPDCNKIWSDIYVLSNINEE